MKRCATYRERELIDAENQTNKLRVFIANCLNLHILLVYESFKNAASDMSIREAAVHTRAA